MTKNLTLSIALMLIGTALAGGAGPRATLPNGAAVTPVRTATAGATVESLRLAGLAPVLVTQQGRPLAPLTGAGVMLPAGSPQGTHVLVSVGGQPMRYALARPVMPGRLMALRDLVIVQGSRTVVAAQPDPTMTATAGEVLGTVRLGSVVLLVDRDLRPVATYRAGVFQPVAANPGPAVYLILTQGGRTTRHTLVQPMPVRQDVPGSAVRVGRASVTAPAAVVAQPGEEKTGPGKVTVCHPTSSASNPYTLITISTGALDTHLAQGGFISSEEQGCPAGVQPGRGVSGGPGNGTGPSTRPTTPAQPGSGRSDESGRGDQGATPAVPAQPSHGHGNNGNGAGGNAATPAAPATPAQPGHGNENGNGGNGATPATPATPAQPGDQGGNGATPAVPAQPGHGKG